MPCMNDLLIACLTIFIGKLIKSAKCTLETLEADAKRNSCVQQHLSKRRLAVALVVTVVYLLTMF